MPIPITLRMMSNTSGGRFIGGWQFCAGAEAHHLKRVAVVYLTSKQTRFKQFGNIFSILLAEISLHLYEMKPLVYTPMWTEEYEVCLCSKMLIEDRDDTKLGLHCEVEDVVQKSV